MSKLLSALAADVIQTSYGLEGVEPVWQKPADSAHGDWASPVALQLSKQLKQPPATIAATLVAELSESKDVQNAEVAGPGYVNVWLTPLALLSQLEETTAALTPQPVRKKEAPVIVEYSDPNIAKPLGVHHILATLIGQAISNIEAHAGKNVIRWNYIGDWGTQFGKLAVAVKLWGDGRPAKDYTVDEFLDLYVRFHEEVEKDATLEDQGRAAFRSLEAGDKELRAFWKDVVAITKESLSSVYERLNVSFDLDLGESFYEDKMQPVIDEGIKKGVFVEGEEGALIVKFDEKWNLPPSLIRKGDGATLYSTRDLAQMRYRIDTYHPKEILILTDIAQKLYFEQQYMTWKMLGWELPIFENVLFGRMRFADKSMSTRKGNVLKLEDVLDEAVTRAKAVIESHGESIQTDDLEGLAEMMGIGAVVYGILSQNRKMDIVFDWDKMLSFEGNSAPYLQYTHARARSVLRKAGAFDAGAGADVLTENERQLIGQLSLYSAALTEARSSLMPHVLANYLYTLSQTFNAFYNTETILKADEPQRSLRLRLTELTADVLRGGLHLLTIRVPDAM